MIKITFCQLNITVITAVWLYNTVDHFNQMLFKYVHKNGLLIVNMHSSLFFDKCTGIMPLD